MSTAHFAFLLMLAFGAMLFPFLLFSGPMRRATGPAGPLTCILFGLIVYAGYSFLEHSYEHSPYVCEHPESDPAACFGDFRSFALSALMDETPQERFMVDFRAQPPQEPQ